jgi:hypothetical protein
MKLIMKDATTLPLLTGARANSAQNVANLAADYLRAWAAGQEPAPEEYLQKLTSEVAREDFKQSVAMGKMLKQVLA